MGVLISMVAFGAGPMSESPIHAPRWVIGVAGVLFASCSVVLVAPESRCSRYLASDYSYPQSIEARIIESLGGIWSPYTDGRLRADGRPTSNISWRGRKRMTAGCVPPLPRRAGASRRTFQATPYLAWTSFSGRIRRDWASDWASTAIRSRIRVVRPNFPTD